MRLLSVFGTRPEAVKMAPLLRALAAEPAIESLTCATGQHREMLDGVLDFFGIAPDVDLDLMQPDQSLNALLARAVERLDRVFAKRQPDRVLVQGDTTTALAAATAAFHRGIPVGHVEAGLRTYAPLPFPEEANRRAIALAADLHFAPTPGASANLTNEQVAGRIVVTGNTGIDALHFVIGRLVAEPDLRRQAKAALPTLEKGQRLILVTGHRRESFGAPFQAVCTALAELAARPDVAIVYPVHPNPNVRGPVAAALGSHANVHLIAPLDLPAFVHAMQRADLILSDSGGVQEEAVTLGKPLLVLRDTTERPEGIAAGVARLVGTDRNRIVAEATALLDRPPKPTQAAPYGDGRAAARIVDTLLNRPVRPFVPA
jgi:UDP-N-acetylglucosamine 2-epimerase (non-hydrolysing)